MTALRRSMIECLQLRGVSERTQAMYVRAVRQLAEHYRTSPDLISEEALRQDFLYVKHVKQYSPAVRARSRCAASRSSSSRPSTATGPPGVLCERHARKSCR
jgi:integrase/recombinase XerD